MEYCLGNGLELYSASKVFAVCQIAFLDTLVSRRNGVAVIDVYRKPTHTDRYLDFSSHHDIKHKSARPRPFCFGHLASLAAMKEKQGKPTTSEPR